MREGIFEKLLTEELDESLRFSELNPTFADVDKADQPHVFARHIGSVVTRALSEISEPPERIRTANAVLALLKSPQEMIVEPAQQLQRLRRDPGPGVLDRTSVRPATPLSEVALLTNAGNGEPSIGHELQAEIASADSVDLVCAFIRWSGVRLLGVSPLEWWGLVAR
ncbi:hypothetical protein ACFQNE_03485 [Gordonia phosphorivorans]|uniref:Uncharacterized protein n=1 Tax=Gordonia phosphorivorans TaxID=1056982 RepID=A0ABV6H8Y9_9ACTN